MTEWTDRDRCIQLQTERIIDMSTTLRTVLLISSVVTAAWVLRRIRKNGVKQEDALYWICFSVMLAVLGSFPDISFIMADILGMQTLSFWQLLPYS